MDELRQLYTSKTWIEPFLVYSIVFFITVSIVFFVFIIFSRFIKIRNQKLENRYNLFIEKMLMQILFDDITYSTSKEYGILNKNTLFRTQLMNLVINLHQNYEGNYAKKLEQFYFESKLRTDSFNKLKNRKWEIKCKGIKELAEMNVSNAFDVLVKISKSNNRILTITALNACVKLNGTNGIIHLIKHKYRFDNWTQLNIIDAIKQGNIEDTSGIELLLTSQNLSVVSLGLKIIQTLQLSQNTTFVQQLISNTASDSIRNEAYHVIKALTTHSKSEK